MQNSKTITAIDVGTTKVLTVIGERTDNGRVKVLGHGMSPCSGMHKGVVDDVSATQQAVRQSLSMAERASGVKVDSVYVGISGARVSYENRVDTVDWVGKHGVITAKELERIPETVADKGVSKNGEGRQVIHAIPNHYSIDGKRGVRQPMGMHTSKMDVNSHLVTSSEGDIGRLKQAVEGAGVTVDSLVLEAIASSESVLTEHERKYGAAMVDIGGGTTDIIIYKNGAMQYSSIVPIGGFQFTNDICVVYNTTYEAAEEVKLMKAGLQLESARIHEEVILPITGRSTNIKVSLHDIYQLMRERSQELAGFIRLKLREGGVRNLTDYRIVLCGGASRLPGLAELIQVSTSASVRRGAPLEYLGVPQALQTPECSTGVGILFWAASQIDDDEPHVANRERRRRLQSGAELKKERKAGGILGGIFRRKSKAAAT